jgi:hypothetical protein
MKNNLVLTAVTDKNGVMTKRWVKLSSPDTVSALTIPPVQLSVPISPLYGVSRSTLLHDLYKAFNEYGDHDEYDIDEITGLLKKFDDHTLRVTTSFVMNEGDFDSERIVLAADILSTYEFDRISRNEIMSYYDAFTYRAEDQFREDAILKLHKCAELQDAEDYSLVDDETRTEARRLLRSAEEYYVQTYDAEDPTHNIILGEKMRAFISDNLDQIDRIDAIMIERQTEDPALVKSIMQSETPSISSGIL